MHRESGWRSDFHIFKCLRVSWPPCALPVSNTRTCTVFREPLREASSAFENEGKLNEGKRCAANWKIVVKIAFWKCERSYWCLDSNNAPDITEENKIKESFRHRGWITIFKLWLIITKHGCIIIIITIITVHGQHWAHLSSSFSQLLSIVPFLYLPSFEPAYQKLYQYGNMAIWQYGQQIS